MCGPACEPGPRRGRPSAEEREDPVSVVLQPLGEVCSVPGTHRQPWTPSKLLPGPAVPSDGRQTGRWGSSPPPPCTAPRGCLLSARHLRAHTHSFCFQVCGRADRTELLERTQAPAVCRSEPSSLPPLAALTTRPGQRPRGGRATGTQWGHEGHSPSGAGQGAQDRVGPHQGLAGAHRP